MTIPVMVYQLFTSDFWKAKKKKKLLEKLKGMSA